MGLHCMRIMTILSFTVLKPITHIRSLLLHINATHLRFKVSCPVHFISLIPSRSTSVFSISLLTTSTLPLFNVLTFHVPMLTLYLSIIWLSTVLFVPKLSIDVSPFGFRSSLENLFVTVEYPSPVVILKSSNLGDSFFDFIAFCMYIAIMVVF